MGDKNPKKKEKKKKLAKKNVPVLTPELQPLKKSK